MSANRIEGRDIDNDGFTAWRGKLCDEDGAVATVRIDTASQVLHLDAKEAARVGRFLLEAAGVDLVGAAQRVCHTLGASDDESIQALAAELAKLEGGG